MIDTKTILDLLFKIVVNTPTVLLGLVLIFVLRSIFKFIARKMEV